MSQEETFRFEPLDGKRHNREAFCCGVAALDRYLKTQASQDTKKGFAICFVSVTAAGRIAGFYTLSPYAVTPDELLPSTQKIPHYPMVPSYLLGRLAVNETDQGRGMGGALLADALFRTAHTDIPAFALVVDALDEHAAAFYQHFGFMPFNSAPQRLFLPLATARKA